MHRPHPSAEAAERAFYAAMADGDLDRMMALWADDDAAVCNHPGGPRLIGVPAIRESFREIFAGGGVRIATSAVHAWRNAEVTVHSLIERIAIEGRGGTELIEVVATNVFVRSAGGWRILMHHAGVSDTSDEDDDENISDDDDDDEDEDGRWPPGRAALDRLGDDGDEDAPPDTEPGRPPPGRLH
jgi:ketosteroid isomerase-like protein